MALRWDSAREVDGAPPPPRRLASPQPRAPSLQAPPPSAFSLPTIQNLGSFTPEPIGAAQGSDTSRPASFTGSTSQLPFQPVGFYPSMWSFRGNGATSLPIPSGGVPNVDALVPRYPSWSASLQGSAASPIFRPQLATPLSAAVSRNRIEKPRMVKAMPRILVYLMFFSFLELVVCAPVSIWFSYYLWVSSTVLFAGPIAAALAMAGVFLVKWGCCGRSERKIKRFKFLVTVGGLVGIAGAFIIPLIMTGVTCPANQVLSCEYDKGHGEAFAAIAALVMLLHGILCIVARFMSKSINTSYFANQTEEEDINLLDQVGTYQPPVFPSAMQEGFVPNRSFTTPVQYHQ